MKTMSEIKWPPTGGTKRFLVTCDGHPFGSFDAQDKAQKAADMWKKNVRTETNPTANSKKDWRVTHNPEYAE